MKTVKTNKVHPLFDSICDAIKPYPEFLLSDVEAAKIKAEKNKLKKIEIEIKTLKK